MTSSAHLRGIVIAGGLAAVALALAFVTLSMNKTATPASAHTVLSLKARHLLAATAHKAAAAAPAKEAMGVKATTAATPKAAKPKVAKPKVVEPKPADPNLLAALHVGLPREIAQALAASPVAVVQLTSPEDSVATLALGEAKAGAALAHASFVELDVDNNTTAIRALTTLFGTVPVAPATFIYQRPGTLYMTLQGFNDRTVVQQAVANAAQTATGAA